MERFIQTFTDQAEVYRERTLNLRPVPAIYQRLPNPKTGDGVEIARAGKGGGENTFSGEECRLRLEFPPLVVKVKAEDGTNCGLREGILRTRSRTGLNGRGPVTASVRSSR